jgi:uncharacterized protein YciI
MFIITLTYTKPIEVIDALLASHRDYLQMGYQKNYLVASGPKHPRTGGILISQLTDRGALEAFLKGDPFALNDAAQYDIVEFTPVKFHPDFQPFVCVT